MLQNLEETLKSSNGGNAGGNISAGMMAQLDAWAKLYGRANRLCKKLTKLGE